MLYNIDNELATFEGQTVTHDLDGNMTNGPLPNGTMATYPFDARNRLTAVDGLTYSYDAENIRTQTDASISLSIRDRLVITDNFVAIHLYRLAQEAVNNAIKHARADRIEVEIGLDGARGLLSIRDNGIGMPPPAGIGSGLGLRIMRQRCGMIDAELGIESPPEGGTHVQCRFPVDNG